MAWVTAVILTAWFAYQIGRRVELGRLEVERDRLDDLAHVRGQRPGNITLSSITIRR